MKLPQRTEGNLFMFFKTNEDYLSKLPENNIQLLVNYTLHEPSFTVSYL